MTEINLPTKATQDEIKTKIDIILDKPTPSNGTDLTKITPFSNVGSFSITSGVWTQVFSLSGKGLLDCSKVASGTNSLDVYSRVIIDEQVVYAGRATADGTYTNLGGLVKPDDYSFYLNGYLYSFVGSKQAPMQPGSKRSHPFIEESIGSYVVLDRPIPFNSSVKVELYGPKAVTAHYEIRGGLIQ